MIAKLLDGKALSAEIRADLKKRTDALAAAGCNVTLAVIMAGDNPASEIYVRNKIKACAETLKEVYPEQSQQAAGVARSEGGKQSTVKPPTDWFREAFSK